MANEVTPDSICKIYYSSNYYQLSLMGTADSYEFVESSEITCGPLDETLGVKTIDYETGEAVHILDFFNEDDFLGAFKKDDWVLNHFNDIKKEVEIFKTFDDVLSFFKSGVWNISFMI